MITFEMALRREQARRGLNQSQAAAVIGVSRSVYSRWVSGRAILPSWQNLAAVATYLGITTQAVQAMFPESYSLRGARGSTVREMAAMLDEVRTLRLMVEEILERLDDGHDEGRAAADH
jgi:transcriptional regulator with XRE-family HTH domain